VKPFDERKPEIAYPCPWSYRIIGSDESDMRIAVNEIVGRGVDYRLELSNESRGGKYRSLELELIVVDEAHRLALFDALRKRSEIKFVF
jgi:putative lipoic acid-binding regulatory protein